MLKYWRPFPILKFLLLPLLYYLGARVGVSFTVMPEGTAILWPPNSVLLAFLLIFGGRYFLPFAGLALLAEIAADVPVFTVPEAAFFGLVNILEAGIAYALLSRWRFNRNFAGLDDLLKFVVAAPLVSAGVAAVFGAYTYNAFRGAETDYLEFFRIWWFGDALGLMILTPLWLRLWPSAETANSAIGKLTPVDALVSGMALFILGLFVASQDGSLLGVNIGPVLFLPFIIFVAARLDVRWTAVIIAVFSFAVVAMMTGGRMPFGELPSRQAVIAAQEFLFITSLLGLGLSALLHQLRLKQREVEAAHAELILRAVSLEQTNRQLQRAEAEVLALNAGLELRVQERTQELENALDRVMQLQGLLPICAWCKKIRDDENYWHSVEEYISVRTQAQFSHGICPDCRQTHFGQSSLGR